MTYQTVRDVLMPLVGGQASLNRLVQARAVTLNGHTITCDSELVKPGDEIKTGKRLTHTVE